MIQALLKTKTPKVVSKKATTENNEVKSKNILLVGKATVAVGASKKLKSNTI